MPHPVHALAQRAGVERTPEGRLGGGRAQSEDGRRPQALTGLRAAQVTGTPTCGSVSVPPPRGQAPHLSRRLRP